MGWQAGVLAGYKLADEGHLLWRSVKGQNKKPAKYFFKVRDHPITPKPIKGNKNNLLVQVTYIALYAEG